MELGVTLKFQKVKIKNGGDGCNFHYLCRKIHEVHQKVLYKVEFRPLNVKVLVPIKLPYLEL